ncbi:MAG: hypothetical protein ACJ8M1_04415 [Chthoniobacterales bacterium]
MKIPIVPFIALAVGFALTVNAAVLSPEQSATITDENGDGIADVVGVGFGHPGEPNYGTTLVQKGEGQFPYERRTVEEFDLSNISVLQSATLTFSFYNPSGSPASFTTLITIGDGQIALSDFSSAATDLRARTAAANGQSFISYDITDWMNNAIAGGASFLTVRQQIVGTSGGSEVFSPQISIAAVPEPATGVLLICGLLSVLGWLKVNRA